MTQDVDKIAKAIYETMPTNAVARTVLATASENLTWEDLVALNDPEVLDGRVAAPWEA
jgi:hypothetical protein